MNMPLVLQVSMDEQKLRLLRNGQSVGDFVVSTAAKGMGFQAGSNRTPTGRFRVVEKLGEGADLNTIFKGRIPVGIWDGQDLAGDLILTRILRIDGIDPDNTNTLDRFIYFHGTNREDQLGLPTSHGCIRLSRAEMVALYELVSVGDEVEILPPTKTRGKLLFIDCDSTLSEIEGIDELGRARGEEVFQKVEALTHAAMNGEIAISEVFGKRMDLIRPDQLLCEEIAQQYIKQLVAGVVDLIREAHERDWQPVILSGGFAPLIFPLARWLGIEHVEAVPIHFHDDGSYAGYGANYPTTRNFGKNEIIRDWKAAMLPERVVMIGDGVSDMETRTDVDCFVGYGGVVARPNVRAGCDFWLDDMQQRADMWQVLDHLS